MDEGRRRRGRHVFLERHGMVASPVFLQQRQKPVADDMERVAGIHLLLQERRRLGEDRVPRGLAVERHAKMVVGGVDAHLDAVRHRLLGRQRHVAPEPPIPGLVLAERVRRGDGRKAGLGAEV